MGTRHHRPISNSNVTTKVLVGIDYFTKWVKAKTLATIAEKNMRSFVCRYGIPRVLVLDNGKQFNNDSFRDFCS